MSKPIPESGYEFEHVFRFTQSDVVKFAEVTGDHNPVHLDEAYAAQTNFRKPIMHGFLSGSIFSKVFGTVYPGIGTIYLEQQMIFKRPMFVDTEYTAHFKILQADSEKGILLIECRLVDETKKVCLEGNAKLLNKDVFKK